MENRKTIWEKSDRKALQTFCEEYRVFLSEHKTERENVAGMISLLEAAGAKPLAEYIRTGKKPRKGQLVYADMMGKSLLVFRTGQKPVTEGARLLGAHIDSPPWT